MPERSQHFPCRYLELAFAAPLLLRPERGQTARNPSLVRPRWACRKGRSNQSKKLPAVEPEGRGRAAKRSAFYDAMKRYHDHFQPLLEAELKAEQATVLAQRRNTSTEGPPALVRSTLQSLVARRKDRLFGSNVYVLTQKGKERDLRIANKFTRGDLACISVDDDENRRVEATVLARNPTHILVTVPIGSESNRLMDTFVDCGELLCAERGTNSLAYERASMALSDLTTKGPNASAISKLLVMSFSQMEQFLGMQADTAIDYRRHSQGDQPQDIFRQRSGRLTQIEEEKWNSFSKETVSKISPSDMMRVLKGLPERLNASQRRTIRDALRRRLTLIQGPPGTGKTLTTAHLISCACQLRLGPVLACAASNVAADNLLREVLTVAPKHSKIVRVGRISAIQEDLWDVSLESLLERKPGLRTARDAVTKGTLKFSELLEKERKVSKTILDRAHVVVTTCAGSGRDELKERNFRFVVVDEATQATEPDVLIPLSLHNDKDTQSQLVLVGDHHQLPPTTLSRKKNARVGIGLETSMFLRLWQCGIECKLLDTQYRMHPEISMFPRVHFYSRRLRDGIEAADRPLPSSPRGGVRSTIVSSRTVFLNVQHSHEERDPVLYDGMSTGRSFFNYAEAQAIMKLLAQLLPSGKGEVSDHTVFTEENIGVISPYNGQVRLLTHMVAQVSTESTVEVSTVDGFQGREKDVIVLSTVRSNERGQVGFLDDWRRLNVALTRARVLLVVVGNEDTLRNDQHWRSWIGWVKKNGAVATETGDGLDKESSRFS